MQAESPPTSPATRRLLAAQDWCEPNLLDALGDEEIERAPLLGRLRELGVAEERLGELGGLLRLQERIPAIELLRLLEDAPSPAPRLFLGRHRDSGADALVLAAPWSDPAQLRRFHRELGALGALHHPLVARVLDAGELHGTCWLAVELVAGRSFAHLLRGSGRLSEAVALALVRRFAGALSALASVGLIHHGVSPAALRLGVDDAAACLHDAGLLRGLCGLRQQAALERVDHLAPEQVRGQPIDERTLVYNLGAILFHALAGAPPFVAAAADEVRRAHLAEAAPDVGAARPELRAATRRIVATALRKAPANRFRSLDQFAAACSHALTELGAPPEQAVDLEDPFAAADAAAPAESHLLEITSRILAKHAALKAGRTLPRSPHPQS